MDQALYAKATEIVWKHTSKYANIILRMGTFHTIMTLLAIIGTRFQDAGLRDTCIESGIIADGSVSGQLEGRMYNRAVRVHTYMKLYFVSPGKVSFPGWMLTTQTRYTQSVHCLTKLAMHVNKCPKQSLTNCSQVMVWQIR